MKVGRGGGGAYCVVDVYLAFYGALYVDRSSRDMLYLNYCYHSLGRGDWVLGYPPGCLLDWDGQYCSGRNVFSRFIFCLAAFRYARFKFVLSMGT